MNFLQNAAYRLRTFMIGRNGADALSLAALVVVLILRLVQTILGRIPIVGWAVDIALWVLQTAVIVWALWRIMSRDTVRRRAENTAFLSFFNKLKVRFTDGKTHKFFSCPGCRHTLRVPKGKGRIYVTCPKCGERFERKT